MSNFATHSQIAIARSAIRALRQATVEARTSVGKGGAESCRKALTSFLKAAETSIAAISPSSPYNDSVKALVDEFGRLKETSRELTLDLTVRENFAGQFRSAMTDEQKAKYISENGQEKFLDLPL